MRTTITLDPDVEALVKRLMHERGKTFKQAVNDAIRAGATTSSGSAEVAYQIHDLGEPVIDVTKALMLAGDLEDQELATRLERGA
jgi:hypothetical protein